MALLLKTLKTYTKLVSYKGKLYAFGVYFVFCLDETNNTWKTISDKSNFMAVIYYIR